MRFRNCFSALALFLISAGALADVQVVTADGDRIDVVATEVSNQVILESLGEQLEFDIVLQDSDWAGQQRSFERSGDVESVLKALLRGTNYLLSYHGEGVGEVTVLAPGTANSGLLLGAKPMPIPRDDSQRVPGPAAAGLTGTRSAGSRPAGVARPAAGAGAEEGATEEAKEEAVQPTQVADLLRTRAQQSAVRTVDRTAARPDEVHPLPTPSQHPGVPDGIDMEALARITRQANQDVQNMADALIRAEEQLKARPPE